MGVIQPLLTDGQGRAIVVLNGVHIGAGGAVDVFPFVGTRVLINTILVVPAATPSTLLAIYNCPAGRQFQLNYLYLQVDSTTVDGLVSMLIRTNAGHMFKHTSSLLSYTESLIAVPLVLTPGEGLTLQYLNLDTSARSIIIRGLGNEVQI